MSPLTKLFVVLLVVLSMLLTAASVVFVNTTRDFAAANKNLQDQISAEHIRADNAVTQLEAAEANAKSQQAQSAAQIEEGKRTLNTTQQLLIARDSDLAAASTKLTLAATQVTQLTDALKASEDTKAKYFEMITALRTTGDERQKQNVELNLANTDLTNKLVITERERQFLAEQLAQAKRDVDKQSAALRDAGISPNQVADAAGVRAGAPSINGVIRAVKVINGRKYASISVGSNDSVIKGMEFKVVNRQTQQFMGVLTVDTVEQNEATGVLEGPKVADIAAGNEVKTQL